MVDFDALAEAMGDLDEDTMTEMLNEVMADGGSQAQSAMDACRRAWTLSVSALKAVSISSATSSTPASS